jgi:hypothetical protein
VSAQPGSVVCAPSQVYLSCIVLQVGVFKLDAPGAVRGNLLLTQERPGARVTEQHQQSWQEGLRLLTFWEYVQKQEG